MLEYRIFIIEQVTQAITYARFGLCLIITLLSCARVVSGSYVSDLSLLWFQFDYHVSLYVHWIVFAGYVRELRSLWFVFVTLVTWARFDLGLLR